MGFQVRTFDVTFQTAWKMKEISCMKVVTLLLEYIFREIVIKAFILLLEYRYGQANWEIL